MLAQETDYPASTSSPFTRFCWFTAWQITNTVESFMTHQLQMTPPPRAILSLILIVGMMTIVRFGRADDR